MEKSYQDQRESSDGKEYKINADRRYTSATSLSLIKWKSLNGLSDKEI